MVFDVLNSTPIDVVLLDIMMPEVNDLEICSQIHGTSEFYLLPIILLTGLTSLRILHAA